MLETNYCPIMKISYGNIIVFMMLNNFNYC